MDRIISIDFTKWLKSKRDFKFISFILFIFVIIISIICFKFYNSDKKLIFNFVLVISTILLGCFFYYKLSPKKKIKESLNKEGQYSIFNDVFTNHLLNEIELDHAYKLASMKQERFLKSFRKFWIWTILLYLIILLHTIFEWSTFTNTIKWFYVFTDETCTYQVYFFKNKEGWFTYIGKYTLALSRIFLWLQFTANNLGLAALLMCFVDLFNSPYESDELNSEGAFNINFNFILNSSYFFVITLSIIYLLIIITPPDAIIQKVDTIDSGFFTLSGLLYGIILSMIIGRFDSKFLGLENITVALLFIYPAIQPLFVKFSDNPSLTSALICLSFFCKIYIFNVIFYAVSTGKLMTYFFCFNELETRVDAIYGNQFEILILRSGDSGDYYFEIQNENQMIFKSNLRFEMIHDCIDKVKIIKKELKDKKVCFKNRIEFGTYLCEAYNDKDKELLFHSKEFKDDKGLKKLVNNAKKKIPYCKVSFS